jgi:hypothetical protein
MIQRPNARRGVGVHVGEGSREEKVRSATGVSLVAGHATQQRWCCHLIERTRTRTHACVLQHITHMHFPHFDTPQTVTPKSTNVQTIDERQRRATTTLKGRAVVLASWAHAHPQLHVSHQRKYTMFSNPSLLSCPRIKNSVRHPTHPAMAALPRDTQHARGDPTVTSSRHWPHQRAVPHRPQPITSQPQAHLSQNGVQKLKLIHAKGLNSRIHQTKVSQSVSQFKSETYKSKRRSTFVSTNHWFPQHRLPETGTARLAFAPTRCECCVDVIAKPGLHCVLLLARPARVCSRWAMWKQLPLQCSSMLHEACQPPSFCSRVGGPTRSWLRWPAFGELGTSRSAICSGY